MTEIALAFGLCAIGGFTAGSIGALLTSIFYVRDFGWRDDKAFTLTLVWWPLSLALTVLGFWWLANQPS